MTSPRQQHDGKRGHRARAVTTTPRKVTTAPAVKPTAKPVVRPTVTTRSIPAKTPVVTPVVTPTVTRARPPLVTPTPTLPAPIPPVVPSTRLPQTPSSVVLLPTSSILPPPITPVSTPSPIPATSTSILSSSTDVQILPLSTTSETGTLASSAPTNTPTASKGTSAGAIIGGVVGGLVAVAAISAAIVMFLRRMRKRKRRDYADAFDAAKFRNSAILLEDPSENRRKPRPPTMIERHVRNAHQSNPPPLPGPIDDQLRRGIPYGGSQQPYEGSYSPYGIQGTYPPSQPTYNMPPYQASNDMYGVVRQGYPPQPVYHSPQSQYHLQQYTYNRPIPPPLSTLQSSGRDLVLPNPFPSPRQESAVTPVSSHEISPARQGQDEDAPPAYDDKGPYTNFKPDVKVKPNMLRATNNDPGPKATSVHSQSIRADVEPVHGRQDSR